MEKNEVDEFVDNLIDLYKDIKNGTLLKEYNKQLSDYIYDDLDSIFKRRIDEFYEDYDPLRYERTGSLYKTYKLKKANGEVEYDFDPKYMPKGAHRVDKVNSKYIFNQSFMKGWHGGAHTINLDKSKFKKPHPHEGTPRWRTPTPYWAFMEGVEPYNDWYEEDAIRSTSPYELIGIDLNTYKTYESGKHTKTVDCNLNDRIDQVVDSIIDKYGLFEKGN